MIHQLRIYEIFAAWRAFMGDQAWIAVKRQTTAQHGDLGAIPPLGCEPSRALRGLWPFGKSGSEPTMC